MIIAGLHGPPYRCWESFSTTSKKVSHTLVGGTIVAYPHKNVHQPWARIQANKSSVAFRPPRCSVADMDHFLGEKRQQNKRILSSVKMYCATAQPRGQLSGSGWKTRTTFTVLLVSRLSPDLFILCFLVLDLHPGVMETKQEKQKCVNKQIVIWRTRENERLLLKTN